MNYSPLLLIDELDAALTRLASARRFLIGLSGGLDSVVLLHAMAQLRGRSSGSMALRAIHVDHQLHPDSANWLRHCERLCASLDIDCLSSRVTVAQDSGVENAAREARYRAFETALAEGEDLLLAHHRDDQMETLLLRLMRGAGSRGLSGMPRNRALGRGRLLRPLLDIDRDELRRYAEAAGLDWVEDASNRDESLDRNYCRHSLLPLIEARWPSYRESWSKSAALAGESEVLLQELASMDLAAIATASPAVVNREKLLALSEPRRRNVLRHWLGTLDAAELGWNKLQQLSNEVLPSESGRLIANGLQLHCFRDGVHGLSAPELERQPEPVELDASALAAPVSLENNGSLHFALAQGEGLARDKLGALSVRYRQGGESCKLSGRPGKTLKKILQQAHMPPWLRDRQPLLFSGEALACIPGIGVSEEFAAGPDEASYRIEWRQPDFSLGGQSLRAQGQ